METLCDVGMGSALFDRQPPDRRMEHPGRAHRRFRRHRIGALGAVVAGSLADRFDRTLITIASLLLSGSCALASGNR